MEANRMGLGVLDELDRIMAMAKDVERMTTTFPGGPPRLRFQDPSQRHVNDHGVMHDQHWPRSRVISLPAALGKPEPILITSSNRDYGQEYRDDQEHSPAQRCLRSLRGSADVGRAILILGEPSLSDLEPLFHTSALANSLLIFSTTGPEIDPPSSALPEMCWLDEVPDSPVCVRLWDAVPHPRKTKVDTLRKVGRIIAGEARASLGRSLSVDSATSTRQNLYGGGLLQAVRKAEEVAKQWFLSKGFSSGSSQPSRPPSQYSVGRKSLDSALPSLNPSVPFDHPAHACPDSWLPDAIYDQGRPSTAPGTNSSRPLSALGPAPKYPALSAVLHFVPPKPVREAENGVTTAFRRTLRDVFHVTNTVMPLLAPTVPDAAPGEKLKRRGAIHKSATFACLAALAQLRANRNKGNDSSGPCSPNLPTPTPLPPVLYHILPGGGVSSCLPDADLPTPAQVRARLLETINSFLGGVVSHHRSMNRVLAALGMHVGILESTEWMGWRRGPVGGGPILSSRPRLELPRMPTTLGLTFSPDDRKDAVEIVDRPPTPPPKDGPVKVPVPFSTPMATQRSVPPRIPPPKRSPLRVTFALDTDREARVSRPGPRNSASLPQLRGSRSSLPDPAWSSSEFGNFPATRPPDGVSPPATVPRSAPYQRSQSVDPSRPSSDRSREPVSLPVYESNACYRDEAGGFKDFPRRPSQEAVPMHSQRASRARLPQWNDLSRPWPNRLSEDTSLPSYDTRGRQRIGTSGIEDLPPRHSRHTQPVNVTTPPQPRPRRSAEFARPPQTTREAVSLSVHEAQARYRPVTDSSVDSLQARPIDISQTGQRQLRQSKDLAWPSYDRRKEAVSSAHLENVSYRRAVSNPPHRLHQVDAASFHRAALEELREAPTRPTKPSFDTWRSPHLAGYQTLPARVRPTYPSPSTPSSSENASTSLSRGVDRARRYLQVVDASPPASMEKMEEESVDTFDMSDFGLGADPRKRGCYYQPQPVLAGIEAERLDRVPLQARPRERWDGDRRRRRDTDTYQARIDFRQGPDNDLPPSLGKFRRSSKRALVEGLWRIVALGDELEAAIDKFQSQGQGQARQPLARADGARTGRPTRVMDGRAWE